MALVPVAADAHTKSYYKYYEQGIAHLTPEQMDYVAHCKGTAEEALEIKDRNQLLEEGMIPGKTGFYPLKEGGLLVAGNIPMPGVTAEMLYWWFGWHCLDPLRYAIWDPEDHYDTKIPEDKVSYVLDPEVPLEQKTWNVTHTVQEAVGPEPETIVLEFANPADFGFDTEKIGTKNCEFLVCANGTQGEMKVPAVMVETAKEIDGVMTYIARFWMGYRMIDGEPKYMLPPEIQIPDEAGLGLVAHNIKEFSNLAKILPQVYAEEKDRW